MSQSTASTGESRRRTRHTVLCQPCDSNPFGAYCSSRGVLRDRPTKSARRRLDSCSRLKKHRLHCGRRNNFSRCCRRERGLPRYCSSASFRAQCCRTASWVQSRRRVRCESFCCQAIRVGLLSPSRRRKPRLSPSRRGSARGAHCRQGSGASFGVSSKPVARRG
jgi:hypothetical protein